jgi:hypothetical protein
MVQVETPAWTEKNLMRLGLFFYEDRPSWDNNTYFSACRSPGKKMSPRHFNDYWKQCPMDLASAEQKGTPPYASVLIGANHRALAVSWAWGSVANPEVPWLSVAYMWVPRLAIPCCEWLNCREGHVRGSSSLGLHACRVLRSWLVRGTISFTIVLISLLLPGRI